MRHKGSILNSLIEINSRTLKRIEGNDEAAKSGLTDRTSLTGG